MRRAVTATVAAVVLALAHPIAPDPATALGRPFPRECDGAVRAREVNGENLRGGTPVLFVHGFTGRPGNFRATREGRPSMLETVADVPGAVPYTFDYSADATQWVTDPAIGPALAEAITCLAQETGERVVVVAHSMGGLATRFAQGQVIDGVPVADSLAHVVTVGTPTRGVLLLDFTNGEVSNEIVQTVVDAAGELCADPGDEERPRLCELFDAANAPAVTAMAPGSPELEALPDWGRAVVVDPVAADIKLRLSVLGFGTTISLGDIVATVESATADPSRGRRPVVVVCRDGLVDLAEVVDESPCSHANELANRRIIRAVRDRVAESLHPTA
jgi:pimeloyl-ACP methyl ester carboxylesterase